MEINVHRLTAEQMKKLFNAVGATYDSKIQGGQYTSQKLLGMIKSAGGLKNWPKFTDDPQANFACDCIIHIEALCDNGKEPTFDQSYIDEVEALKEEAMV